MSLEDDYLYTFGKTKDQMNIQERYIFFNNVLKKIGSEKKHSDMLKNDIDAYHYTNTTNISNFLNYANGHYELLGIKTDISNNYMKKFYNMLLNNFDNNTDIIFSLPGSFALYTKAIGIDVDIESYLLIKDDDGFRFISFKVDDEPFITRDIPITIEKAKYFFYKSNRNTINNNQSIINIFEINNKQYKKSF